MIIFYGERANNGKIWYNKKIINSKRGIILKIKDFFVCYIKHYYCILNFDINKKDNIETSANYLESLLLETAGMPKDSYTKYVESVREEIPVITNHYYMNNDGDSYEVSDSSSPYFDKLQEYWRVIYYNMFDNK